MEGADNYDNKRYINYNLKCNNAQMPEKKNMTESCRLSGDSSYVQVSKGHSMICSCCCRNKSIQAASEYRNIEDKLTNAVALVNKNSAINVKFGMIYSPGYSYLQEVKTAGKYAVPSLLSKYIPMSSKAIIYQNTAHFHTSESKNEFTDNGLIGTQRKNKCIHCVNDQIFNDNIKQKLQLVDIWPTFGILRKELLLLNLLLITLMTCLQITSCHGLLATGHTYDHDHSTNINISNRNYNNIRIGTNSVGIGDSSSSAGVVAGDGLNPSQSSVSASGKDLDNLERSVAAVILKVAYSTTSTTKRSILDPIVPSITTIATPPLTTIRYLEKAPHHQPINMHHRNYELDLERDHALPTSAPNADILKSNNNPTYPNPNRYYHGRERARHILISSTAPSLSSILQKNNSGPTADIPMYPGEMPSYSPPARSFFTPPLPPEYQSPFADKPTLRGTNNEGIVSNTGNYINRRPIPPPSLMPGHERIPFRPPDLAGSLSSNGAVAPSLDNNDAVLGTYPSSVQSVYPINTLHTEIGVAGMDLERKKALNTPSRDNGRIKVAGHFETTTQNGRGGISDPPSTIAHNERQEVLPSIRRILSGSNGNKGEIPEVLLKQVTSRPVLNYHQPPSSPVVLLDITSQENPSDDIRDGLVESSNINQSKTSDKEKHFNANDSERQGSSIKTKISTKPTEIPHDNSNKMIYGVSTTLSVATVVGEVAAATSTSASISDKSAKRSSTYNTSITASSSSRAAAAAAYATWAIAWNIHVYLSVILFTILGVYSLYKILTYNKLTHLFSQSYFICIHLILLIICLSRIFFLCYDAYNIHSTFHIFVSEILLNLPATFLTISFSVLILFLFLKSLNHKNNRYSALIRPLTVTVGCGIHVVLCITLHYVESYTLQNYQQHLYYQQQLYRRQQAQEHASAATANLNPTVSSVSLHIGASNVRMAPPRVLSLICQIIYIFICLSLGCLYLYIYRILKRILRSKSQNYIHGFQNLSYAVHITIATALLFILLAVLQIFGAISISITRPITTQSSNEMDWLQWGYQFSLRLIEIAIITLMSWVAGLKTSCGGLDAIVGDGRLNVVGSGSDTGVFGSSNSAGDREKHPHHLHNHNSNMTGFFFPCTSSSSQEQFETDYPAMCNANTNLHTYTMRTGKLIYEDSFALNSLGSAGQSVLPAGGVHNAEFQVKQLAYQRPYDTGSCHSSTNPNIDFSPYSNRLNYHGQHQYGGYVTDTTADHYENPNFELRAANTSTLNNMPKVTGKTSTTSTTSCSGGSASGASAISQQQMLLLQSDTCYSEPMQQNYIETSNYEFNNFERPKFAESIRDAVCVQALDVDRSDQHAPNSRNREKKSCTHLEYNAYENPERRSSNSTNSCSSGGCSRFGNFNSFELNTSNGGMLKNATLNNTGIGCGSACGRTDSRCPTSSKTSPVTATGQAFSGMQTLGSADSSHLQQQQIINASQRSGRNMFRCIGVSMNRGDYEHAEGSATEFNLRHASLENASNNSLHLKQHQRQQQYYLQHNSDGDMMLPGSNVERRNLISNGDEPCASNKTSAKSSTTPSKSISAVVINGNDRFLNIPLHLISPNSNNKRQHQLANNLTTAVAGPDLIVSASKLESSTAADSGTSSNMLVADDGFVRLRASEDVNDDQDVNIHNASLCMRKVAPTSIEHIIAKKS